ncbi:phage tail protein [Lactococcus sp. bn62]|uniref:phage tail protein n=1 Tax=Lactococcus sp. bn62 TaxID=3037457 RepID=UPI0024C49E32|nr:phage tail protein [Lactococcus sp. bn62]WKY24658.1 phage tail protein [Lactococcus sp. bn62]
MLDGWFKIGDHWSEEFQMFLSKRPEKKKAQRMFTLDEVSGVNKFVLSDKGYYTNEEQTLDCFYVSPSLGEVQWIEDLITSALDTRGKYVDFIPYYDPKYIYKVVVINSPTFSGEASSLRGVPFSFDVSMAPFKYRIGGERPIELLHPQQIFNPERYGSEPRIKIFGKGSFSLFINNRETKFKDVEDEIIIDSNQDVMEVYKEINGSAINLHNKFIGNQEFPYLDVGGNQISWSGNITKIEIEPRWQTKI